MKRLLFCFIFSALAVSSAFANDTVNWAQLGPSGTQLITPEAWVSNSSSLTGLVGLVGTAIGTPNFERVDQGNGWAGNFFPGDALLWNQGNNPGDIGIQFDQLTFGGGAQIQADLYGAFTATLTAFDSLGNVIGTTVMNGNSNSNNDGSAIFISFLSNSQNVFFLNFHVSDIDGGGDEALDALTIYTGAPAVPEPGSMLLFGTGLLGIVGYGRRRLGV